MASSECFAACARRVLCGARSVGWMAVGGGEKQIMCRYCICAARVAVFVLCLHSYCIGTVLVLVQVQVLKLVLQLYCICTALVLALELHLYCTGTVCTLYCYCQGAVLVLVGKWFRLLRPCANLSSDIQ